MTMVAILGEGAWGTAIATLLASNGITVKLWCYDAQNAENILATRCNKQYLSDVHLSSNIVPTSSIHEAISDVEYIFEAVPVKFLRQTIEPLKGYVRTTSIWIVLSKGIEQETLYLPSHIINDALGFSAVKAIIAGPSYAKDLSQQEITAVTLAVDTWQRGKELQAVLANDYFKTYLSFDMIGAQVGGAIKNVITLAIGMLDGAGYKDNVKAFILTRGLREMVTIAEHLGGEAETLYGLCGVGDLVLTAMGKHSKNQKVGRHLGQGRSLETILDETGFIPEGVNTVQSLYELITRKKLDLPICAAVYDIIFNYAPVSSIITSLMKKPLEKDIS